MKQFTRFHRLRFLSILCAGLMLLAVPAQAPAQPLPRNLERYDFRAIDLVLREFIRQGYANGLGFIIVKDGEVVYEQALGTFTLNTVAPIASASKVPTVTAFMTLVDAGLVSLEDPVAWYLSDWPKDKQAMTIRQSLSCTHGLPFDRRYLNRGDITLEQCASLIGTLPLWYAPGEGYGYGGNGFQLAARIAEVVTGRTWQDHFQELLGKPLGMTAFTYNRVMNPDVSGGARSNLEDYAKLLTVHLNRGWYGDQQILRPRSVFAMRQDQIGERPIVFSPYADGRGYGFGWWRTPPTGKFVTELSDQGANGTSPWIDLEYRYGAFLLINRNLKTGTLIKDTVTPLILKALAGS